MADFEWRVIRPFLANKPCGGVEGIPALTHAREVRCTVTGQDTYGWTLARCVSDGAGLNKAMVWSGMTKQYK